MNEWATQLTAAFRRCPRAPRDEAAIASEKASRQNVIDILLGSR